MDGLGSNGLGARSPLDPSRRVGAGGDTLRASASSLMAAPHYAVSTHASTPTGLRSQNIAQQYILSQNTPQTNLPSSSQNNNSGIYFSSGTAASNTRQASNRPMMNDNNRNLNLLTTAANTAMNSSGAAGVGGMKSNLNGGPSAILQQSATTNNLGVRPHTVSATKPYSSSTQR